MAKLNNNLAQVVSTAQDVDGGFDLLEPGRYVATLFDVESRYTNAGDAMWVAVFNEITKISTGERVPGRQWYNLVLPSTEPMPADYRPRNASTSPEKAWEFKNNMAASRLRQFFNAMGYSTDTDTEDMIGDKCVIQISVRTIQSGARKGERTNSVAGVFPLPSDWVDQDDTDDDF